MRYFVLLGLVLLTALSYTGYWFYAAGEVVGAIEKWAEQRRAMGMSVAYDELEVGGYPFRIRVDAPGVQIGVPAHPLKPVLNSASLSAIGQPWKLNHILVQLNGAHELRFAMGTRQRSARLDMETGLASIKLTENGAIDRISLDFGNVAFAIDKTTLAASERLQVHYRPGVRQDSLFDLAIQMGRSNFAIKDAQALGNEIAAFDTQLSLMGAFDDVPAGVHPVLHWRDQGGTLEVNKFHLAWGPMITDANGTLSLDDQLRPLGAMTTKITGYEVLVDVAREQGQLSDEGASAAKAALGLLAVAGGGRLSVPLNLQDGYVFLGPVKLARLAPVIQGLAK
jgi:hypothetical protein